MNNSRSSFDHLALEFVRVTEEAALAASKWIGKGDPMAADKAAVDAMRRAFNEIHFNGEIVIGEGAKDKAPELYIGEKIGNGEWPKLDVAVDPLECTSSVAFGRPNAIAVIAMGPKGTLYKAIDSYMQKIAVPAAAASVIDLDAPAKDNIAHIARALGKDIGEVTVAVLERPRQATLIEEVRAAGARVQLFTDGDVAMAIATCLPDSPVDVLLGTGGSTEAVLAAAALRTLGGEMLCRWAPWASKDNSHKERLEAAGITDQSKIFTSRDLAQGDDIAFTATGVVSGPLVKGVVFGAGHATTQSVVMVTRPGAVRFIDTKYLTPR